MLELIEDALGDPRNARALAVASDLAYLPEADAAPQFRDQLGLDARLFNAGNTQVYLAQNDKHIVVAFRGTELPNTIEGLKDCLLTDAMNLLMVPEGRLGTDFAAAGVGARFHKGFIAALGSVWDPLLAAVEAEVKRSERPLWVTGHSLGGALALLAAWLFHRKFISVHQVYTYGAPMIGNAAASQAFDKEFEGKIFRYVNPTDPVPKLPTFSLLANDYGHCLKEMVLGSAVATEAAAEAAADSAGGALDAARVEALWQNAQQRVASHSLAHYRELIAKLFGDAG
jgi:triacylglycerol lipase